MTLSLSHPLSLTLSLSHSLSLSLSHFLSLSPLLLTRVQLRRNSVLRAFEPHIDALRTQVMAAAEYDRDDTGPRQRQRTQKKNGKGKNNRKRIWKSSQKYGEGAHDSHRDQLFKETGSSCGIWVHTRASSRSGVEPWFCLLVPLPISAVSGRAELVLCKMFVCNACKQETVKLAGKRSTNYTREGASKWLQTTKACGSTRLKKKL